MNHILFLIGSLRASLWIRFVKIPNETRTRGTRRLRLGSVSRVPDLFRPRGESFARNPNLRCSQVVHPSDSASRESCGQVPVEGLAAARMCTDPSFANACHG